MREVSAENTERHSVMMDGVFADTTEPWTTLFPGGGKGKQSTMGER